MMQSRRPKIRFPASIAGQDRAGNDGKKGKQGDQITDLLGGGGPE